MIGSKLNNIWTNLNPNEIKASFPDGEVLIFHDGMSAIGPSADSDLVTWEADKVTVNGDFIGNLNYGEIYAVDAASNIVLASQDTWVQITSFDINGISNGATPDHTNDHITVSETGKYIVSVAISSHSTQSNDYEYKVKTNNGTTDYDNLTVRRTLPVANATGSAMAKGIVSLTANDTVEVWVQRLDGGAVEKTLTVEHINFNLILIGK